MCEFHKGGRTGFIVAYGNMYIKTACEENSQAAVFINYVVVDIVQ